MADNVVSINSGKKPENTEQKVNSFVSKYSKVIIIAGAAVLLAAIVFCIGVACGEKAKVKDLSAIDTIEFNYTKDSSDLDDAAVKTRQDAALEGLQKYLKKGGSVGTRANMLSADIAFAQKNYSDSLAFWLAAADHNKKAYTAPVCWYNAAVCSEELNNSEDAIKYYQMAADTKDFLLVAHAIFSVGRVKESVKDYEGAKEAYQKLVEKYPSDKWTDVAHSRLISLEAEGKISE